MPDAPFASDWLALREPVDHRSRSAELATEASAWLRRRGGPRVIDLGSGTGSNLRYLAPRLPPGQHWTLVDHDAGLLERACGAGMPVPPGATSVDTEVGDLAGAGLDAVEGADLVTASALLDLVSLAWLERFVVRCREARCAVLIALSWDGAIDWHGAGEHVGDSDDTLVRDAVGAHQRSEKGLGIALGPDAATAAADLFTAAGFSARLVATPWRLAAPDAPLIRALIDGWAAAAEEQRPDKAARIRAWADRRRSAAVDSKTGLVVGHLDLIALPPERFGGL